MPIVTAANGLTGNTTAWGLELNGGTLITKSLWAAPWSWQSPPHLQRHNAHQSQPDNPSFITLQRQRHNDPPTIGAGGAKFDTDGNDIGIGVALQGSGAAHQVRRGNPDAFRRMELHRPDQYSRRLPRQRYAAGVSNSLYALALNSGTLAAANAGDANLGNFQLRGDVTVGGSSSSAHLRRRARGRQRDSRLHRHPHR